MLASLFRFFDNLGQRMDAFGDGMLERTRAYFARRDAKALEASGISPIITSAELRIMAEPYKGKRLYTSVERALAVMAYWEECRINNIPKAMQSEPRLIDAVIPLRQELVDAGITHEIMDCIMVHQSASYLITVSDLLSASQEKILEHVLKQTRKELAPRFEAWELPDMMPNIPEGEPFELSHKRQSTLQCLSTKGLRYFPDCRRKDVYDLRLLAMMA